MRDWTMDQVLMAPLVAIKELDLRRTEIEALRKENEELRAGINEICLTSFPTPIKVKVALRKLLSIGGA